MFATILRAARGVNSDHNTGTLSGKSTGTITILDGQTARFGDALGDLGNPKTGLPNGHVFDVAGLPGGSDDHHIYRLNDGGSTSVRLSQSVGDRYESAPVSPTLDQAPTLTGTGLAASVTEQNISLNSGETSKPLLFTGVTITDLDPETPGQITGAVVRISSNFQSGATHQDFLRISGNTSGTIATSGITYSYNSATGSMVLSGTATVAQYKSAIELVTFSTSGDDITAYGAATTRQVAVSVSDGLDASGEIFATVTVTGINDRPVNAGMTGTFSGGPFVEDAVTGAQLTGISVSDVDSNSATQDLVMTFSVDHGTLTFLTSVAGGIVAGDISANGSGAVTITATQNEINATLAAAGGLRYFPTANFNGNDALTVTTNDQGFNGNDPGTSGTGTSEADTDSRVISISAVNDPITTAAPATATVNEDSFNVAITGMSISDTDATLAPSGIYDVTLSSTHGTMTMTSIAGLTFTVGDATDDTTMTFHGTLSAINTALATAKYTPTSNYNGSAQITLQATDTFGGIVATGSGSATNDSDVIAVTVNSVNDEPAGADTSDTVNVGQVLIFTASDFSVGMTDTDGNTFAGVKITTLPTAGTMKLNGVAISGGATITLAQLDTGQLTYEPAAGSGGTSPTFTFQVQDNGGVANGGFDLDQTPNTFTIDITDDGKIYGTAGNDTLFGTPDPDFFDLHQGGSDTASGLAGNDGFYFGAALNGSDVVDGGAGADDQVGLQGNYAGLVINAANFSGIETFALIAGNVTIFGDAGTNFYDYNLTTSGSFGRNIIVNANGLRIGEDFTFNGSAEATGSFTFYGGFGVETLTGGAGNDGFYFGPARWGASDMVNGGGGSDNQLGLRGDYSITFGAAQLTNIQTIALLSDMDPNFTQIGDGEFDYSLVLADSNLGAGQQLTVTGSGLGATETMVVNGSAETNGTLRLIGGRSNDVLTGGAGADLIFGGLRGDTLTGGAGNDVFRYDNVAESNSTERDGIQDFNAGDLIDLSRIDANTVLADDQAFNFIGSAAFSNTAGELRYENISLGGPIWMVQGDTNGDGVSDWEVVLVISPSDPITSGDFWL